MSTIGKREITDILDDNLLSREELIEYIKDDFRIDLQDLEIVSVYKTAKVNTKEKIEWESIPHHRYTLFYDRDSHELHVFPNEGVLRIDHIKLEVECVEELYKKKISVRIVGENDIDKETTRVKNKIIKACKDNSIKGIIVGSMWNFNFYLNKRLRPDFLSEVAKFTKYKDLDRYIDYRITLLIVEEELIRGALVLDPVEKKIFKEGYFPNGKDIKYINRIASRIDFFEDIFQAKKSDENIFQYILLDYIFFKDLNNRTNEFEKTTTFPETVIVKDNFLSFQLLSVRDELFVNFGWAHPTATASVIKKLQEKYDIKLFYMYGKCGSISKEIKVGQLIAPNSIEFNDKDKHFFNAITDVPMAAFCSVDSPLVETKKWLTNKRNNNIKCVEMELYPIINILKENIRKYIIYYASDYPEGSIKLSNRFEFLEQRIASVNRILDDIFSASYLKNKTGLIGLPIQNIRQENHEYFVNFISTSIDFLHIDISDGFVGARSDIVQTKQLLEKIYKVNKSIPIQLHLFATDENSLNSVVRKLNWKQFPNISLFVHINRDNYHNFTNGLLRNPYIYVGLDARDVVENVFPKDIYSKNYLLICLQSKDEPKRIENIDLSVTKIKKINPKLIITLDRSLDYTTLAKIENRCGLNIVSGSYLRKDLLRRYRLLKNLVNK